MNTVLKLRKKMSPEERAEDERREKKFNSEVKKIRQSLTLSLLDNVRAAVRAGKLDLLDAGIIEGRLNKGRDLKPVSL